jgi:aminoglycoside phosphotransferase
VATVVDFRDGYSVGALEAAPAGLSHRVFFGVEVGSDFPVVLKMEQVPGRLMTDHRALTWLHGKAVDVPEVRWFGVAGLKGERPTHCLVTERIFGTPARTAASWWRMGVVLQRLAGVSWKGSGLPTFEATQLLSDHRQRCQELAVDLTGIIGKQPIPSLGPLILTHGDPGDGNYLESDTRASLIDWEHAQIAPRGLDLARAVFLALLRTARSGSSDVGNAQAVMAGYLTSSAWRPTTGEMKWWLEVAGVQMAYNRLLRSDEASMPPWRDAVLLLEATLSDNDWMSEAGVLGA